MAYERPRIIAISGRTIRIAHPELPFQPKTYTTAAVAALGTSLTVQDNTGLAQNDFIRIGKFSIERSEIVRISAAVTRGTALTSTAVVFAHPAGSEVERMQFNQWRVYGNATNTPTGATLIATIDIQVDAPHTTYINTGTEFAFYLVVAFNSNTSTESDQYSDGVSRTTGITGYSQLSVGSLIGKALAGAKAKLGGSITTEFVYNEINDCLRFIAGKLKRWSKLQAFDAVLGASQRGIYSYTLPADIEDNDSIKSILGVRVGTRRNFLRKDKREWEDLLFNVAHTQIRTAGTLLATTLAVDNDFDFNDGGTVSRNLVGYWKFDENTGTTAFDSTTNGNNGAITGAVYVAGQSGRALDFDGTDDIVTVTDAAAVQNIFDGGGGLSVWINADNDGEGDLGRVIEKNAVWNLRTASQAGTNVELVFEYVFSGTNGVWSTAVNIPIDTWTHIIISYNNDSVNNDPVIYINGASVTVTEDTAPVGTRTTDIGANLLMGNNAATTRTFDGEIDEVRLYSASLSAGEALTLFQNPGGGSHTVNVYVNGVVHSISYTDLAYSATAGALLGVPYSGTGSIPFTLAVDLDVWQNEEESEPTWFTVYDGSLYLWPLPNTDFDNKNVFLDYYTNRTEVDSDGDTIEFDRFDAVKHWLIWKLRSQNNSAGELNMNDGDFVMFNQILIDMVRREVSGQKHKMMPKYNRISYGPAVRQYESRELIT